jgi:hypothetical protein
MTTPTTDPATNPTPADTTERIMASAKELVLGRIGHYSYAETCQTALVVKVQPDNSVNVVAFDSDGDARPHLSVPTGGVNQGTETFHLTRECPWGR